MNRDSQAQPAGRLSGAQVAPAEQPRLQQQVDQLHSLSGQIAGQLGYIQEGLDRIQQQPPHPVDDRAHNRSALESGSAAAARPTIEVALAQLVGRLEDLLRVAEHAAERLNRAV